MLIGGNSRLPARYQEMEMRRGGGRAEQKSEREQRYEESSDALGRSLHLVMVKRPAWR